jgi:Rieske Fe-S protein
VKNTRREFLTGLTKVAGGAVLGYVSLPVLAGCLPTSVPLEPEQTSTALNASGQLSVDVSSLTQNNQALVVPNFTSPTDNYGVIVTLTTDGIVHAFSMRCTHQGCPVYQNVGHLVTDDGTTCIPCSCHNSGFALDGSVVQGPATVPLTPYQVVSQPTSSDQIIFIQIT